MKNRKICIIAPVHIYNDIRVFKKEALTLANVGYQIVLFARVPTNTTIEENGIEIKPVMYRNRLERFWGLVPLFFRALRENADAYHLHNPDMIPYVFLLKLLGKKVVYDTHEDFSKKILLRQWIPLPLRKIVAFIVHFLEKVTSNVADGTIVTQEEQQHSFPNAIVIGNAPIFKEYQYTLQSNRPSSLELVYLGGISKDRGLFIMLELVSRLNRHLPSRLTLVGNSVNDSALEDAQKDDSWQYVRYLGSLPQAEAFKHVAQADFGLVTLLDVADYRNTSPNKIYEYMMLKTPFIATGFPKWVKQLDTLQCGLFITVENQVNDDLIDRIINVKSNENLKNSMSVNGYNFIKIQFNWKLVEEPKLLGLYKQIFS